MLLLSANACQKLNLIKVCNVINAVEHYDKVAMNEVQKIIYTYNNVFKKVRENK